MEPESNKNYGTYIYVISTEQSTILENGFSSSHMHFNFFKSIMINIALLRVGF